MSRQDWTFCASIAVLLAVSTAPATVEAHAQHHATRIARAVETTKTHTAPSAKGQGQRERATTAVLNRDTLVSVGPQASAFRRIRDIAMAPTG